MLPDELRISYTDTSPDKTITAMDATKQWLNELKSEAQKRNIPLVVVLIPNQFQVDQSSEERLRQQFSELNTINFDTKFPNKLFGSILNELHIPFVDLTDPFSKQCSDEHNCSLYVCRFCHLSEKGHTAAASVVSPYLVDIINRHDTDP